MQKTKLNNPDAKYLYHYVIWMLSLTWMMLMLKGVSCAASDVNTGSATSLYVKYNKQ